MARIAFFTESLPPADGPIARFSWELIRSLADQNHEIRVYSTYRSNDEALPSHPKVEILRPFRTWGFLELPRVAPLLVAQRPDVLHLIQPHAESTHGLTNAMTYIAGFAPLLGKAPVIASLFDIDPSRLWKLRGVLGGSDALTVSNDRQAQCVLDFFGSSQKAPMIEVVPLGFATRGQDVAPSSEIVIDDTSSSAALDRLLRISKNFICVPGPLDLHFDPIFTFRTLAECLARGTDTVAAITGGWGSTPLAVRRQAEDALFEAGVESRVFLTGPLPDTEFRGLLRKACAVLIAPVLETRLGFMELLRICQNESAPLVLSLEQARLDPIDWADGVNALIRARETHALSTALIALQNDAGLRDSIRRNVRELSRAAVQDSPGNIVSRLYSRLLTVPPSDRRNAESRYGRGQRSKSP